jgi:hypothetical protein
LLGASCFVPLIRPAGTLTCFAFFGQCDTLFWRVLKEPSDVAEEVEKVIE